MFFDDDEDVVDVPVDDAFDLESDADEFDVVGEFAEVGIDDDVRGGLDEEAEEVKSAAPADSAAPLDDSEFTSLLYLTLHRLRAVVPEGEAALADTTKGLRALTSLLHCEDVDETWQLLVLRRVSHLILLAPASLTAQAIIIPLLQSANHTLVEMTTVLAQRLSAPPLSDDTQSSYEQRKRYVELLQDFKCALCREAHFQAWRNMYAWLKKDLARDGYTEAALDMKNGLTSRLSQLRANEMFVVTVEDVTLKLVGDEDEEEAVDLIGSRMQGATALTRGQRMLTALREESVKRKQQCFKMAVSLKQLLLNCLEVSAPAVDHQFIELMFEMELHDMFVSELRALAAGEAHLRDKRGDNRVDEHGFNIGSDQVTFWRALEFLYQVCRYTSPAAAAVASGARLLSLHQPSNQHVMAFTGPSLALDAGDVLKRTRMGVVGRAAHQQASRPGWLVTGDRRRFRNLINLIHRETKGELTRSGEMFYVARDTLHVLSGGPFESTEQMNLARMAERLLLDVLTSGWLESLWNAWRAEIEMQTLDVDVSKPTVCRLLNLLTWFLVYSYSMASTAHAEFDKLKAQTAPDGLDVMTGAQLTRLEELLTKFCYWSRTGFANVAIKYVAEQLRREFGRPAAEKCHAVLRAGLRIIVMQNAWAGFLYVRTPKPLLKEVGRGLFNNVVKNRVTQLIARILQKHTTSKGEAEVLFYCLIAVDQLSSVAQQIPTVATQVRKVVKARNRFRNVLGTKLNFNLDEEEEEPDENRPPGVATQTLGGDSASEPAAHAPEKTSDGAPYQALFQLSMCHPHTLTKLLLLASRTALLPAAVARAVLSLLGSLQDTHIGKALAWDLQRTHILAEVLKNPDPGAAKIQQVIRASIRLLADTFTTNRFVVCEMLFGTLFLQSPKQLDQLLSGYGDAGVARSSGWTTGDIQTMLQVYDRHKFQGGLGVMKHLRDAFSDTDDLEERLRPFNLVDPVLFGDATSEAHTRDCKLTQWLVSGEDAEFFNGQTIAKLITADEGVLEDPTFKNDIMPLCKLYVLRTGGTLDDICVGMLTTAIMAEILKWQADQRWGSAAEETTANVPSLFIQELARCAVRHCTQVKNKLRGIDTVETQPSLALTSDRYVPWVRGCIRLIGLLLHMNLETCEPFEGTALATLELRSHFVVLSSSKSYSDIESKVVAIDKTLMANIVLKPADCVSVIRATRNVLSVIGKFVDHLPAYLLKHIEYLERYSACVTPDKVWLVANSTEAEEEASMTEDSLLTADAFWGRWGTYDPEKISEGLGLPNVLAIEQSGREEDAIVSDTASLGPFATSIEYQSWLYSLAGTSNRLFNPTRWEWDSGRLNKHKLAKLLLVTRFAIYAYMSRDSDILDDYMQRLEPCVQESEIWQLLQEPLPVEIDESCFAENPTYVFTKQKQNKKSEAERSEPAAEPAKAPAAGSEQPVVRRRFRIKKKRATLAEEDEVASMPFLPPLLLAIEDAKDPMERSMQEFVEAEAHSTITEASRPAEPPVPLGTTQTFDVQQQLLAAADEYVTDLADADFELFGNIPDLLEGD